MNMLESNNIKYYIKELTQNCNTLTQLGSKLWKHFFSKIFNMLN